LTVLTWNEVALFDGALLCETPQAFQEEFLPFSTAQTAHCITMSCHLTFSFATFDDQFTGWRPFFLIPFIWCDCCFESFASRQGFKIGSTRVGAPQT
jgi:hypothetical protein